MNRLRWVEKAWFVYYTPGGGPLEAKYLGQADVTVALIERVIGYRDSSLTTIGAELVLRHLCKLMEI